MSPPTAIIVEDEPVLRQELRHALVDLWPELVLLTEAGDGIEALQAIDVHSPDIMFLDIELPGMSGLELASLVNGRCHVVFVTAFNEHAIAAFEHGAIDYVLKPVSIARLATTVDRLKHRAGLRPANLEGLLQRLANAAKPRQMLRWIQVSCGQSIRFITTDEVSYFKSDNKYTLVATSQADALISKPIYELLGELDPDTFWQIHRGTIVNVNEIAGVQRNLHGNFEVRLKHRQEKLVVSPTYAHRFRQA